MNLSKEEELIQALAVTAEAVSVQLSPNALNIMVDDLMCYELEDVLNALNRCRKELSGRLPLAEIIKRINSGWVSADEAFNEIVRGWNNEQVSITVTETALEASGSAYELFQLGDKTGARMAFKSAYERLMAEKEARGERPVWTVSAGLDKDLYAQEIKRAVQKGLLSKQDALMMLPSCVERVEVERGKALTNQEKQQSAEQVKALTLMLEKKRVGGYRVQ